MRKNVKYLISSALVTLSLYAPDTIHGMDDAPKPVHQKKPGIQLTRGSGNTLTKLLGMGDDIHLEMSIDLDILKATLVKDQTEVAVRLFLTDSQRCPTSHPAVDLTVEVGCESTPLTCVLPNKPQSFGSYAQFTDWLNQGYFKNEIRITYDFDVDVQKSAPSLAQHLFSLPPNGYHFIGTHAIENSMIKPEKCVPEVAWRSQRGAVNATTVTLQGTFYLKNQPYPVAGHQQIFPHPMVDQKVFKKDRTKKFYHHGWLAQSQITVKATYEEFAGDQLKGWPTAPAETYSLLRQKPGDLKEICHIGCWDGFTGETVDISGGKIFLMDGEGIAEKSSEFQESIVTDEEGKHFIMRYVYSQTPQKGSSQGTLEEEAGRLAIADAVRREEVKVEKEKAREAAKQNIENLKKQLEAIQNELDTHIKAYKLEQQREEREKVALREKVELCSSRIDTTIQRLKELQHDQLTYEELVSVLDAMEDHYDDGTEKDMMHVWREKIIIGASGFSHHEWRQRIGIIVGQKNIVRRTEHDERHLIISVALLKKDVSEMMDKYKLLSGAPHPRWDEFNKM